MHARFSLPLFLVLFLGVFAAACDSEPGVSRLEVDGTYAIDSLTFKPAAAVLPLENVKARLDQGSTGITFASGSSSYGFTFKFDGAPETYLIQGRYSTEGDNRVVVNFGEDNRDRRRLLLPPSVKFAYDEVAQTLTVDANVSGINLEEYDPDKYGGSGLTSVNGRLNIVLTRR